MEKEKQFLTIGELIKKFNKLYPDLTASKLRFLEYKGLISPKRSDSRYRLFGKEDVRKISYILKMQKDFFMPLDIIKKRISSVDFSKINRNEKIFKELQLELGKDYKIEKPKLTSLNEVKEKYKLSQSFINELLENNIISRREEDGKYIIDVEDMEIIKIAIDLSKFGIQIKHLKLFENFASRHASFIQQIILPMIKSSNRKINKKAVRLMERLEEYLCSFHAQFVKKENKKFLNRYK